MDKDKTYIYLIRHGECAGNKERRIRGCIDFPLNENGLLQARALAAALKDKGIEYIYSSPLSRATTTAKILGDAIGIPYETRDGFCNIHIGIWENRIKAELAAEHKITPKMHGGILSKVSGGQIGVGYAHTPLACFEKAMVCHA